MKATMAVVFLCAAIGAVAQSGPKPCEDLKSEIAKKLDDKGVTNYTLTIVDKGKESETPGKIVGSCDGGTKSIVYSKTAAAPEAKPAAAEKKP